MKKTLLTLLLLIAPVLVFAATNDFTANSDITVSSVTFGVGTADMLILNGSTAESWIFSSGTFTVTNPGTFKVGSSDSSVKSIQFSSGGTTLVCAENSTPGTSFATAPTASGTYTVTPSATTQCTNLCSAVANAASYNSFPTCGAASCNTGYKLSGSGGSATCVLIGGGGPLLPSGYVPPNATKPRPQIAYPDGTIVYLDEGDTGTSQTETSQPAVSPLFTSTMQSGSQGADVYRLQQLLASDSSLYPEGLVTGYYGSLTTAAVGQFQLKYGVVASSDEPGYGIAGPKTRAKLQEVFSDSSTPIPSEGAVPSAPANEFFASFSRTLSTGVIGNDVKKLQQFLNTDPDTRVAESGAGSPDNETDYYGPLTESAVQKFQAKHGIVSSGTPETTGYGLVGPKTRTKLNELLSQ